MAPFLAVTLSLLIVEPDMPQRKSSPGPGRKAAAAAPPWSAAVDALLAALRSDASPAADALLRLLDAHKAPSVDELLRALQSAGNPAGQALLATLHPNAAGVDIGAEEIWVCFPPGAPLPPPGPDHPDALPGHVRCFRTFTADLERLAQMLLDAGVDTAAMESTGVYWVPLFDLLQDKGVRPVLADARQTHDTPGRPKTDVKDCMWIQRLHSLGLLRAAFRPDEAVRVLRSYQRHRQALIADASRYIQRIQKALELMNVKLTEVVSDVTGVTGMAIIRAIVAGQRDPVQLACLRQVGCKNDQATIALALQGSWRQEHLFELQQCLEVFDYYQKQIAVCDGMIEAQLTQMALPAPPPLPPASRKPRRRRGNDLHFDARPRLHAMCGVDLTAIEGIEANTALLILSEIGTDMSRWANEKKFGAWLGLAPNPKKSGGKLKSARTRPGAQRAAQAFRLAARTLMRSKSALGAFYRRVAAHRGAPKAITATAYKLARIVYGMLKRGTAYAQQGLDDYEAAYRERQLKRLRRQAKEMGFELTESSSAGNRQTQDA
jgi:transposase